MANDYNFYNLEAPFKLFLNSGNKKISPISISNYLSDLRHFFGWIVLTIKNKNAPISFASDDYQQIFSQYLTEEVVGEYLDYLKANNIPLKTINRRLSTLRKFCSFCISQGWINTNPAKQIANVQEKGVKSQAPKIEKAEILEALESPTTKRSASRGTLGKEKGWLNGILKRKVASGLTDRLGIQHYIGITIVLVLMSALGAGLFNQFFNRPQTPFAYPAQPTKPSQRYLSFQGRVTDSLGNPIVTATNFQFKLYSTKIGGTPLYSSSKCSLIPDQDGILNVLIGGSGLTTDQTVCGAGITNNVFTDFPNVYLGITVGSDAEATPRQQIASVGYAINAETLQGLPLGVDKSTIPYLNADGDILIATSGASIKSVWASANFTIASANNLVLQSASSSTGAGDIILQATGSGALKFRTAGDSDTYTRLYVGNNGKIGINTNSPDRRLEITDSTYPQLRLSAADSGYFADFQNTQTSNLIITGSSLPSTSGTDYGIKFNTTINQISGTAGYTALLVNVTETAVGSGTKNLLDLQVGGVSRFSVSNTGLTTLASDIAVNGGDLTTSATTFNLVNATATTLNIGGAATTLNIGPGGASGSISLSGGSGDTGCTVDGTTGDFACSGDITGAVTGTVGYWTRAGTTLSTATAGDAVTTSGNISTTGTGTITSAGTLTASNGLTLTTGALSLTSTSGAAALILTSSTSAFNVNSGLFNIDTTNSRIGIGTASPANFKLEIVGNIGPSDGSLYDLGSSARRWSTIYGDTGNFINIAGTVTGGSTTSSDWLINSDNVSDDTESSTLTFERGTPGVNSQFRWNSTTKQITTNAPSFVIAPDNGITYSGTAALIVDQIQNEDVLTASASGTPVFTVTRPDDATANGFTLASAAAGNGVSFAASGTDSNVNLAINAKGSGTVDIGGTSTGDVNLAGGSGTTGCTITNSNGNLACAGTLTSGGTAVILGSGTLNKLAKFTATGSTIGDSSFTDTGSAVTLDNNVTLATTGTGTITSAGLLTGSAGLTITGGTASINTTGTAATSIGNATGTFALVSSGGLNVTTGGVLTGVASIDTITTSGTALTFTSTAPTVSVSTAATGISLEAGTTGIITIGGVSTGGVNIAGSGTGDVNLAGGSGTTGCTITNSTGALACAGNITGPVTGTIGYWTRAVTTLSPATGDDVVSVSSNDAVNPVLTLISTGASANAALITANSTTTGNALGITANGLSSGNILSLTSTSTAATGNTQKGLNISLSGTNATSAQTTYGVYISNTHAGTTSTNVGLYATATGGTTANYAAIFENGNVGIGTAAPGTTLAVLGDIGGRSTAGWTTANIVGSGINLIHQNTSFENNDTTGWTQLQWGGSGTCAHSLINTDSYEGTYSYKVAETGGVNTIDCGLYSSTAWVGLANIPVTFSVWAKASVASGAKIHFYLGATGAGYAASKDIDNTWKRYTYTYYPTATYSAVEYHVFDAQTVPAGQYVLFDGGQVEYGTVATYYKPAGLRLMAGDGRAIATTASGTVGIGTGATSPDAKLEVSSTTEQLRLTYTDNTVDSRFTVDLSGNLNIDVTGTKVDLADDLEVSGNDITFGNGEVLSNASDGNIDIANTSTGLRVSTAGVLSDIDGAQVSISDTGGFSSYASSSTSSATSLLTNWLRSPKNTVSVFVGDNDDTSGYAVNDISGDIRFNGAGVNWGDFGYYPNGGGAGNQGNFRLSLAGSTIDTTPDAKLGVGSLYAATSIGIANTSPGTTLDVTGTGRFSSTLTASNGLTLTTGALSLTSTSGVAALTLTSSTTAFNVNSGVFDIDTTNSRVGIGTPSPGQTLTVNGSAGVWNNNTLSFYQDSGTTQRGFFGPGRNNDMSLVTPVSADWLRIGTNGAPITFFMNGTATTGDTPQIVFDSTGYVGIGITAPTHALDIVQASGDESALRLKQTDQASAMIGSKASDSNLYISNTYATDSDFGAAAKSITLSTAGNVGIGTDSPAGKLDVRLASTPTAVNYFSQAGDYATYDTGSTNSGNSLATLDSTHVVVAYASSTGAIDAKIGTVGTASVAWGSSANVITAAGAGAHYNFGVAALDSTHFAVCWATGTSNVGQCKVGSVSGTTISLGSAVAFNASAATYASVVALDSTHFAVSYSISTTSGATRIGLTDGGTTISSYGTEATFNAAQTAYISSAKLSSSSFVVSYQDTGNSSYGTAIAATVSGTTITFGSETVYNSATTDYISTAALSSSAFVTLYQDAGEAYTYYSYNVMVGTVSGTTITFGGSENFLVTYTTNLQLSITSLDSTHVAVFGYAATISNVGIVSGYSISWSKNISVSSPYVSTTTPRTSIAATSSTSYVVVGTNQSGGGTAWLINNTGTPAVSAPTVGGISTYNAVATNAGNSIAMLDSSHAIMVYAYSSSIIYAKVGAFDGSSSYAWSAGTTVISATGAGAHYNFGVAALDSTHFVVCWATGTSNVGQCKVGSVSGTTITLGSAVAFDATAATYASVTALDSTHFAVSYYNGTGQTRIGLTNGATTISSYGTAATFNSGSTAYISSTTLSSSSFVVSYQDTGNSSYGTAVAATVSGTTITFGSETVYNAAVTHYVSIDTLSSTSFITVYRDDGNSNRETGIIGTVSGTTITFGGGETVIDDSTSASDAHTAVTALDSSTFAVSIDSNTSGGKTKMGTISNTYAIVLSSATAITSGGYAPHSTTPQFAMTNISSHKYAIAFTTSGGYGMVIGFTTSGYSNVNNTVANQALSIDSTTGITTLHAFSTYGVALNMNTSLRTTGVSGSPDADCGGLNNGDFGLDDTSAASKRIFWKFNGSCNYWTATGGFDVAEHMPISEPAEAGDILIADPAQKESAIKSNQPYQQSIIGIVSTKPYLISNREDLGAGLVAPLALAGRTAVKVTSENGVINIGDPVTSSSTKGFGMKSSEAGPIVGKALEKFDPENPTNVIDCPEGAPSGVVCRKISVLVNISWFDPQIILTSTGEVQLTKDLVQTDENKKWQLADLFGNVINRIGAFSELVTANVQAGFIRVDEIIATNITTADKIVSPIIETTDIIASGEARLNQVSTNVIKPQEQDLTVDLTPKNASESGALARIIIKGLDGKTVSTIDAEGNASFSGTLIAKEATISGTIAAGKVESKEASISGRLTAKEIESETISDLRDRLTLAAQDSGQARMTSQELSNSVNDIQTLLADIRSQPLSDPQYYQNLENNPVVSSITVSGDATFYKATVATTLSAGTISIEGSQINSLTTELKLNALSTVNILDGAVIIARDGTMTTTGTLIAKGGIEIQNSDLRFKNGQGVETARIDASGSARLTSLTTNNLNIDDKYLDATSSAIIISPQENFNQNGLFASAIETQKQTVGIGLIPLNDTEIVIYNQSLRENSLVYLTPTTQTSTQLNVIEKEVCGSQAPSNCKPYFKVAASQPTHPEIGFNWLIIN